MRVNSVNGGPLILCKKNLIFVKRKDINSLNIEKTCEIAAVQLPREKLIVISVYRMQLGNFDSFLSCLNAVLEHWRLWSDPYKVVICGDFNVYFNSKSKNCLIFWSLSAITVTETTRGNACLDNILVKLEVYIRQRFMILGYRITRQ